MASNVIFAETFKQKHWKQKKMKQFNFKIKYNWRKRRKSKPFVVGKWMREKIMSVQGMKVSEFKEEIKLKEIIIRDTCPVSKKTIKFAKDNLLFRMI